jgi:aryl-alcohol dehydrogenase-like predicted oxidoreductase
VRYREAGGARISVVGLGCWQFGSREWGYGETYAREVAPELVRRCLDLGMTLFDTAEIYGFGRSERILGAALGERRSEAFVATKLFPVLPVDPVVGHRARASARRLGTEVLDLYQLHWPNPVVPLSATMRALSRLRAEGLVAHIGVSNFSLVQWQRAEELLGAPILSNQVRYNLIDRRIEGELLPWAQAQGRLVIAYSPLQQGLLSARYSPDSRPRDLRAGTTAFLPENLRRLEPLLDCLRRVAAAHQATPAQVALAWLLRHDGVVVIPGASSLAQAESNAAAAELELREEEEAELTAASDAFEPLRGADAYRGLARHLAERFGTRLRGVAEGLRA